MFTLLVIITLLILLIHGFLLGSPVMGPENSHNCPTLLGNTAPGVVWEYANQGSENKKNTSIMIHHSFECVYHLHHPKSSPLLRVARAIPHHPRSGKVDDVELMEVVEEMWEELPEA